ncbi:11338_t:CDS:1, partial [Scutellospora calospora]
KEDRLFIDLNPESLDNVGLQPKQITIVAVLKDGGQISLEDAGL